MTHPQYRLARRVPSPPDAVLAAIRAAIARTGRRGLPPHLPTDVHGVSGNVRGRRFTVGLQHSGEGGDPTELVGMVVPAGDGGSDVRVSVLDSHRAPTQMVVLLGLAGVLALAGMEAFAWIAAGFAVLVLLIAAFRDATGLIDHDVAAFLLQWLNDALDPLDAAGADAEPSAADPPRPSASPV